MPHRHEGGSNSGNGVASSSGSRSRPDDPSRFSSSSLNIPINTSHRQVATSSSSERAPLPSQSFENSIESNPYHAPRQQRDTPPPRSSHHTNESQNRSSREERWTDDAPAPALLPSLAARLDPPPSHSSNPHSYDRPSSHSSNRRRRDDEAPAAGSSDRDRVHKRSDAPSGSSSHHRRSEKRSERSSSDRHEGGSRRREAEGESRRESGHTSSSKTAAVATLASSSSSSLSTKAPLPLARASYVRSTERSSPFAAESSRTKDSSKGSSTHRPYASTSRPTQGSSRGRRSSRSASPERERSHRHRRSSSPYSSPAPRHSRRRSVSRSPPSPVSDTSSTKSLARKSAASAPAPSKFTPRVVVPPAKVVEHSSSDDHRKRSRTHDSKSHSSKKSKRAEEGSGRSKGDKKSDSHRHSSSTGRSQGHSRSRDRRSPESEPEPAYVSSSSSMLAPPLPPHAHSSSTPPRRTTPEYQSSSRQLDPRSISAISSSYLAASSSTLLPIGPRSSRIQVSIAANGMSIPSGPKSNLVINKFIPKVIVKGGNVPTGPRANGFGGGNSEGMKKFFPGTDDDDDRQSRSRSQDRQSSIDKAPAPTMRDTPPPRDLPKPRATSNDEVADEVEHARQEAWANYDAEVERRERDDEEQQRIYSQQHHQQQQQHHHQHRPQHQQQAHQQQYHLQQQQHNQYNQQQHYPQRNYPQNQQQQQNYSQQYPPQQHQQNHHQQQQQQQSQYEQHQHQQHQHPNQQQQHHQQQQQQHQQQPQPQQPYHMQQQSNDYQRQQHDQQYHQGQEIRENDRDQERERYQHSEEDSSPPRHHDSRSPALRHSSPSAHDETDDWRENDDERREGSEPRIDELHQNDLAAPDSVAMSLVDEHQAAPAVVEVAQVVAPVATEIYERIVQVGEGTYGKVYKAKNVETGHLVALKRIRMEAEKDGFPVTAVREIKLLQNLRHPNVVDLIEMMVSRNHVYMVFEYVDHDLTGVLHHPSIHFTAAHLKSLMKQFLEGLGFIHRRGVLHRDLKGSNILLSKKGELKIADFGLARFYKRGRGIDYTNRVITQWYKPPELLFGATVYGFEVDMWSAGCIFLELFARRPVFQGQDEIHQLDVIFKITGTPSTEKWPTLRDLPWYELVKPKEVLESQLRELYSKWLTPAGLDLAERLLYLDPSGRPDCVEALRMEYFTTEDPRPEMPDILVKGEWHEYESKRARKRQKEEQA